MLSRLDCSRNSLPNKFQDDFEPIQQWSASLITDCQVQNVSHRKQTVAQPTLVITLADKERKRRSSRAAGLVSSNKDSGTTALWFRTPSGNPQHTLDDWARFISSKKSMSNSASPVSPVFTSPFTSRSRDMPEYFQRPGSSGNRLQHKSSTATYSTGPRDRPVTFSSESPSLRSKRSDLSSPSTTNNNYPIPGQLYTTVLPTDIGPSGEHNGDSREGGSPHGRSAVNSPANIPSHMRDSMSSHGYHGEMPDVNAPPAPGETILDRAFKLGHVPFAIPDVPGQEKLSSIARFDALMRDAEQRRLQKQAAEKRNRLALQSRPDDNDSSEETQSDGSHGAGTRNDAYGQSRKAELISPTAHRALEFIAGRKVRGHLSHRPSASRNHLSFHADTAPAATITAPPVRPHTAHAKSRPGAQRTQSTPHLVASPATLDVPNLPSKIPEDPRKPTPEKRISGSSSKRLSLNDITKRFSSTSSLLLVQTNASGASSRRSSEVDVNPPAPRTNLSIRGNSQAARNREEQKCGWRGSVNVVSSEGGFM